VSLSVCLIARNEELNIARAIDSVPGADEVIVVDTGSADATSAIAAEHGARVFSFPWCDDFAAARNFCHDQATGDWILSLDADEELLPDGWQSVRPILSRSDVLACLLLRQDLTDASDIGLYTEMWLPRLFRRHSDLKLVGRCHADFAPPLSETASRLGMQIVPTQAKLRHWGYTAALKPAKLQRAAHLLALELQDRPGNLYYLIEYGRTLAALNDPLAPKILDEATEKMLAHRHDDRPPTTLVAPLIEFLFADVGLRHRHVLDDAQLNDLALRWFPESIPLLWSIARIAFSRADFAWAAQFLRRILTLRDSDTYDKSISFDPRMIGDDLLLNLGVCCTRMAELDEAEVLFTRLLKSSNKRALAEKNLEAVRTLRSQQIS